MSGPIIDEKTKDYIKNEIDKLENIKEEIVRTSIRVSKLSKMIIYSLIRDDKEKSNEYLESMYKEFNKLSKLITEYPMFREFGETGLQEYVEAITFHRYIKNKEIPKPSEIGVDIISYLMGLSDFVGELYRKSVEEILNGNINFALESKKVIENIMMLFLYIEPRDYKIRKKLDYISGVLNNLNEKIFYVASRN